MALEIEHVKREMDHISRRLDTLERLLTTTHDLVVRSLDTRQQHKATRSREQAEDVANIVSDSMADAVIEGQYLESKSVGHANKSVSLEAVEGQGDCPNTGRNRIRWSLV